MSGWSFTSKWLYKVDAGDIWVIVVPYIDQSENYKGILFKVIY